MIEIEYDGKNYSFKHDGEYWEEKGLMEHLIENGHERELTGFGISYKNIEAYNHCSKIARKIEKIFDKKEKPINVRG